MIRPFSGLTYPGRPTVLGLVLIGLVASITGIVVDRAYIFAFSVSPVIMLTFGFREAGLRFGKDPIGTILFYLGCTALIVGVYLIRYALVA